MTQFKTLLQREWMQHQRGWLLMMLVPPLVMLLGLLFSDVRSLAEPLTVDGPHGEERAISGPMVMMAISMVATTSLMLSITWLAVGFMAPGQARRDHQDRSIEFWLSLPVSNSASIGASVLMQFFFVPLLALGLAGLCSVVIGSLAVLRVDGVSGLLDVSWGVYLSSSLALILRLSLGAVLFALWVMPLLMLAMVASAWLKRWGVPVLISVLVAGSVLLKKLYGMTWHTDLFERMAVMAGRAWIHLDVESGPQPQNAADVTRMLGEVPGLLWLDAMSALRDCAQPLFLGTLMFSAACFALLVWRRGRGA